MKINSNEEIEESDTIFHDRSGYDQHRGRESGKK